MAPAVSTSRAKELALQALPAIFAFTALTTKGKASESGRYPPAPLVRRLVDGLLRPPLYWLFHSFRLFGYGYMMPFMLAKNPKRTLLGILLYALVHRLRFWQVFVHRMLGYGASNRHKIVNPSKHLIKDDKRYLFSLHPHSILADGWHSIIAKNKTSFEKGGNGPPEIGRKVALCFAPVIQHVPVHQEMYRDMCGAADRKAITRWWKTPDTDPALIPGGFAESVFANAADKSIEYSYIKDRKGFIKICLEEGKDIIPCYTFKSTWMYYNPGWLKGMRARISQKISLGLVAIIGKFGTAMPLRDDTTTVVMPPFEVTSFRPDQLDECHAAYMKHLKQYFDVYKAEYGMDGVELQFVGGDYRDDDIAARALRRVGLLSDQVKKKKAPGAAKKALPPTKPMAKL